MSNTPQENQDFKHHAKFDPIFHFIAAPTLLLNLIAVSVHLYHHHSLWNTWLLALSVLIIFPIFRIRMYPLKVQDRVIRLEERLRLRELSPAEWHPQIQRLSEDQLVGLRFASDDEVVALARQALEQNLTRKQIKERIRTWRADYWRV